MSVVSLSGACWVVTEGAWINQVKGHKRAFISIPKLSSHHTVNTENMGVKDKLCFGEGGVVGGAVGGVLPVKLSNRGSFTVWMQRRR